MSTKTLIEFMRVCSVCPLSPLSAEESPDKIPQETGARKSKVFSMRCPLLLHFVHFAVGRNRIAPHALKRVLYSLKLLPSRIYSASSSRPGSRSHSCTWLSLMHRSWHAPRRAQKQTRLRVLEETALIQPATLNRKGIHPLHPNSNETSSWSG